MDAEFVRDAQNYLKEIRVNGKAVKAGFVRGWRKAEKTSYWQKFSQGGIATNPFSGVEVALNSLEMTIYSFCLNWYKRYERGIDAEAPIQTYDDMKYFLLEINPNAYFDLLD